MATRPLSTHPQAAPAAGAVHVGEPKLEVVRWSELRADAAFLARWSVLENDLSQPNPFFSHWALCPALDAIEGGGDMMLAVLRDGDRLDGLLPLSRSFLYYGRPLPHLASWLHHNAFCGTPLVRAGHEHRFWSELLRWCDEHAGGAVFLHLKHLPEDGPLFAALRKVTADESRPAAIVHREERALLQSDLSPEEYFSVSLAARKRKELRRQHRRLQEEGAVAVKHSRDGEGLERWISQFLALEKAGWKGSEGSALACQPETEAIFRKTLSGAAEAGVLERLSLTLDERPIAMLANFMTAPGGFAYKTTYDETYARFSPGVLLQRENLTSLSDPAIEWVDSCAAADHPMIDSIWRERRTILRVSVALGGRARRLLARTIFTAEAGSEAQGL